MKARIRKTGEIVEVYEYSKIGGYIKYDIDNKIADINDVEIISNDYDGIDWEQRRYEIAKDVLASSFATPMDGTSILSYVRSCVQIADILIAELKGGEK